MSLSNEIVLLDLFSGIGGFALGLAQAGFKIKQHLFSEIDKNCIANYLKNFPDAKNIGDIKKAKGKQITRPHIVAFGSPCQDISIAGKRQGVFGKRSSLFFEAVRLIRETKPYLFIFENVKGLFSSNKGKDFEIVLKTFADIGLYDIQWQLLNTSWFLPQNRERIYIIGSLRTEPRPQIFPFCQSHEIPKAGIQEEQDNKNIASAITTNYHKGTHARGETYVNVIRWKNSKDKWVNELRNTTPTLKTHTDIAKVPLVATGSFQGPYKKGRIDINSGQLRRLTPLECERLQGFPDNWTSQGIFDGEIKPISVTQRYRMIGNAVSVAVVKAIGKRLLRKGRSLAALPETVKLIHNTMKSYPEQPEIVLGDAPEINIPEIKITYERNNYEKFNKKIEMSSDADQVLRNIYPEGEIELQEQVIVLYLNRQNKVIGYYRHTKGGITGTIMDVRLILLAAVKSAAVGIILSHNHPSGNLKPSEADLNITKKINEACKYFEISLLDHVIIAKEGYYSFADEGLLIGTLSGIPKKQYDTEAKRINAVKKKGNIITFKYPWGWKGEYHSQVLVTGFEKDRKSGAVKIIGKGWDSLWYKSMDEQLKAIDWDLMEAWHSLDGIPDQLPPNENEFVEEIKYRLQKGEKDNKKSLEKLAAKLRITDKTTVKELTELAIVQTARIYAGDKNLNIKQRFEKIVSLYENQVNLSHRTSQSILLQQYSTPAPIGFLAGVFCGIDKFIQENKTGFEPSAGNGLLTIAADPSTFIVNEIDRTRNKHLSVQGYKNVYKIDATENFSKTLGDQFRKNFDAVITNPPFGKAGVVKLFDGYPITTLEHLMAIRALNTMKDKGKAAIIIGNHTSYDEKDRVQKGANRIFLNYLYSHYDVADVIPIDGQKLYSRQGTGFNTRLILINGRKTVIEGAAPVKDTYRDTVVRSFDELFERVSAAMEVKKETPTQKHSEHKTEMKNPEVALAFQTYWKFKAKHQDTIPLVVIRNNVYTFSEDAFYLYDITGLLLNNYSHDKTNEPYVRFPHESIDVYLNRFIKSGKRVALIEELQNPKSGQKDDPFSDAFDELDKDLRKLKGEDLGAPYQPVSESCVVLNTVVPDSMDYETKQALELIRKEVGGDIDEFVRQRLGYAAKTDLCKALSAEQTDAVAMAIYNIEAREQGMIIGDQTGIGKGRVAAAMIRYAVLQGFKPIFITEKPNLFSDIYRDLIAIGSGHLVPFIVNGRESKTDIKDENGEILHQALPQAEQQKYFKEKRLPVGCHFVVATYTQFNSPDKKPEKPQFLLEFSKGNILILDESHNASGSSQTGGFMQQVVYNTKGVVFLSATFAKRPDNMPIYAMKTAISDANMNKDDLIYAIVKGGVALQEVLASQLVKEGQMLRRERSFEGVEVNYITLDELETEHKAIADNITEILREIISFQSSNVEELVEELDKIAVAEGKEVDLREGTSQAGVDNVPYFSKVFQVINQMLFAIKAEAVADRAIERLREGKKPVIAFASTMGSFIEQMENEKGLPVGHGDIINADFSEVLMRGLEGILRYTETTPEGQKVYKKFDLTEFNPETRARYLNIATRIKEMSSGLCISPIDLIVQKIKAAGYTVSEVTGRKYEVQLNMKSGKGIVMSRNKVNTNDAFRQFNNNEIDVLMINQSGSTGASAHAIVTKKVKAENVKQRVMIVLQAELNINTEVQKRGRINRTGQILSPVYDYVMSAIPAEKRLMMMLQKKLKSLDANTTSNQKQSTKILDVPDFLNKYGDKIVTQYLIDNPEVNKLLGDPLKLDDTSNEDGLVLDEAAHKVSGRVAVLSTKMQAEFYNEISQSYNDYVDYLKQIGEYDLEVEAMNLETETISSKVVVMGKGGDSEFGTDSILEKVNANVLRKPFKKTELENILHESLGNKRAEEIQKETIKDYETFAETQLEKDLEASEKHYDELIKNVTHEKKLIRIREKEGEEAFLREATLREKELKEAAVAQANKLRNQFSNRKQYLNSLFKFFYVGRKLFYPMGTFSEGDIKIKSVFIGFIIDKKKKNPYAPSNIRLRFALSSSHKYIAMPASYTKDINAIIGASYSVKTESLEDTLQEWENDIKASDVTRNTRHIVTGNLLQAFTDYKGKLVSYTTKSGEIRKGILMPEYWEAEGEFQDSVSVPVLRAAKVIQSLVKGDGITTENSTSIFNNGDIYRIIVPASRQKGGDVYLNEEILALVNNNNFEKTSDKMVAFLQHEKIDEFLSLLQARFNDSVKLSMQQFKLIQNDRLETKKRNPIKLLSPEEVKAQEALVLEMEFAMAELELDMEMLQMRKRRMAA